MPRYNYWLLVLFVLLIVLVSWLLLSADRIPPKHPTDLRAVPVEPVHP